MKQAISQHLRNQQEDGIRSLYVYSQIVLSLATQEGTYATNATPEKFWAKWEEKFTTDEEQREYNNELVSLKNKALPDIIKDQLFSDRFRYVRQYFDTMAQQEVIPTEQDKYLYGLCRPERLMELVFSYILFDNGEKKVARYQQSFVIRKSIRRIAHLEKGRRKGGVILAYTRKREVTHHGDAGTSNCHGNGYS